MSKYTMTLQEYAEGRYFAENPSLNILQIAAMSDETFYHYAFEIFPDVFPFWSEDSEYIEAWKKLFTDHFRFDEIGFETMARFRQRFKCFLNERMPYYVKLAESEFDLADIATDTNITVTESETIGRLIGKDVVHDYMKTGSTTQHGTDNTEIVDGAQYSGVKPFGSSGTTFNEITKDRTEDGARNRTINNGTTESGRDAGTLAEDTTDNTTRGKSVTTEGFQNIDPLDRVKRYRELILQINGEIFAEAKKRLFMLIY